MASSLLDWIQVPVCRSFRSLELHDVGVVQRRENLGLKLRSEIQLCPIHSADFRRLAALLDFSVR